MVDRIKIVQATVETALLDYVKRMPGEKLQQERLELLNGLYPNGEPRAGDSLKVVE